MRTKTNAAQNNPLGIVVTMPWRVAQVHPLKKYCLEVVFLDGMKGKVDMSKLVASDKAGVFAVLRNESLFNQVYNEYGVVTWPGEIDLAPDAMYYEIKRRGKWVIPTSP